MVLLVLAVLVVGCCFFSVVCICWLSGFCRWLPSLVVVVHW